MYNFVGKWIKKRNPSGNTAGTKRKNKEETAFMLGTLKQKVRKQNTKQRN